MSVTFINWTSRIAIAGHVVERRRLSETSNELMIPDYHLPLGKAEARAEADKWLWQI